MYPLGYRTRPACPPWVSPPLNASSGNCQMISQEPKESQEAGFWGTSWHVHGAEGDFQVGPRGHKTQKCGVGHEDQIHSHANLPRGCCPPQHQSKSDQEGCKSRDQKVENQPEPLLQAEKSIGWLLGLIQASDVGISDRPFAGKCANRGYPFDLTSCPSANNPQKGGIRCCTDSKKLE